MKAGSAAKSPEQRLETRRGVRTWLRKQAAFLLILAGLLFIPAGRLDWLWGWVQLVLYAGAVAAQAGLLIWRDPELLAERAELQPGSQGWDVALASLAVIILPIAAWVVAGLDERFGWSPPLPLSIHLGAALVWLLGYGLTIWAMASNTFFSTTVRIQAERGHYAVSAGPYAFIRHPGYLGALIFQLATPLMLGSVWGLIPSALAAGLYVLRTALEDRLLLAGLRGYPEYARRVRARLLPGVW